MWYVPFLFPHHGFFVIDYSLLFCLNSAVQCNLSGQPDWMITEDAPDPRDVFWQNIHSDRSQSEKRKILVQVILLSGIIGWSYFVSKKGRKLTYRYSQSRKLPNAIRNICKITNPLILFVKLRSFQGVFHSQDCQ